MTLYRFTLLSIRLIFLTSICYIYNAAFAANVDVSPIEIINKIKDSSLKTDFIGTAVFENLGGARKVSSITQVFNNGTSIKKVVSMSGMHVVEIHSKNKLLQYLPAEKLIKIRNTVKPSFPSLFFGNSNDILKNYILKPIGVKNNVVAGFITEGFELLPKDNLRWGVRFWTEIDSGLLLKTEYLNSNLQVIKRDYFVDINIRPSNKVKFTSPFPGSKKWRRLYISRFNNDKPDRFSSEPVNGFKLVKCFDTKFKQLENDKFEKNHCMFSDGVASISMVAFANQRSDVYFAKKVLTRGCSSYKSGLISNRSVSTFGCVPIATIQNFFSNSIVD
jgi:sigma-E factor negative regulatory protein RseB